MANLAEFRGKVARQVTTPLASILSKTRITPNFITWLGLALNIVAAAVIATNHLLIGGLMVFFAGAFDLLDGALARLNSQTTHFGALLDSTFDRISEAVLFLGLLALYIGSGDTPFLGLLAPYIGGGDAIIMVLIFLSLIGSFLISYIRARAEGLGLECQAGLFTRFERVIILMLGLMLSQILIALLILVVLSFITVGQRLVHVWKQTRS